MGIKLAPYRGAGGGNYLRESNVDNGGTRWNDEFFNVVNNPQIASTFRKQGLPFLEESLRLALGDFSSLDQY